MVYYAVNKPEGYVSTNFDPSGRPRVIDLVPDIPERVYTVGRLDEDSTGLLILTNDGELANRLAHPRYGVEKLYLALVAGTPSPETLSKLTEGVWLSDGKVRAKRVRIAGRQGQATVLELVLAEGKKREIRRMLAKLGHKVMSLTRVAVGPITLKGLPVGECRPLTRHEVDLLHKVASGVSVSVPGLPRRALPIAPRPGKGPARRPAGGKRPARRPARREGAGTAIGRRTGRATVGMATGLHHDRTVVEPSARRGPVDRSASATASTGPDRWSRVPLVRRMVRVPLATGRPTRMRRVLLAQRMDLVRPDTVRPTPMPGRPSRARRDNGRQVPQARPSNAATGPRDGHRRVPRSASGNRRAEAPGRPRTACRSGHRRDR